MTMYNQKHNKLIESYLSGFAKSLDINNEISLFKSEIKIASLEEIWKDVWKDFDIAMNEFNKVNNIKLQDGHVKRINSFEEVES